MTEANEEAYRDLLDLEATLDALSETPGWQALEAKAREVMDLWKHEILSGASPSHEAYVKRTWQLRGAEWVLTGIIGDVRNSIGEYRTKTAEIERGQEQT